ncbi:hypothetical protein Q5752_005948 [Cryptotrichosporon argae]
MSSTYREPDLDETLFDFDQASIPSIDAASHFPSDRRQSISSASDAVLRDTRDLSPFSSSSLSAYSALSPHAVAALKGGGTVSPAVLSLSPHTPAAATHHLSPGYGASLLPPALSPPGTASPNSSFVSDEYLLNAPFAPDELDMLFFPGDLGLGVDGTASAQSSQPGLGIKVEQDDMVSPFFLPQLNPVNPTDQTFDLLKYVEGFIPNPNAQVYPPMADAPPLAPAQVGLAPQAQFDGLLQQWRGLHAQAPQAPPEPAPLPPASYPVQQPSAPAPRRSAPNAPLKKRPAPSPPPGTVGKHNKTERRYRAKVQMAQTDLRDAVPALRVLYGTSTPEQLATTDSRAPDGTVDGLGEVTRPNASAKTTILIGAKMYIELLQRRTNALRRRVHELEEWRAAAAGVNDLERWRADFDERERVIEAAELERIRLAEEAADAEEEADDDDDDDEQPAKRKRPRTKKQADLRTFAAFAVSFSVLPSLSSFLPHAEAPRAAATAWGPSAPLSSAQVVARLPLITAQHVARLLGTALPAAVAPRPHALVDWAGRLLVALLVVVALGPVMRWASARRRGAGVWAFGQEVVGAVTGRSRQVDPRWVATAAGIVGGAVFASPLVKHHAMVHLGRSSDPYALAILALLQPRMPFFPSPTAIWARARALNSSSGALGAVLALPLAEASTYLAAGRPTSAPIAAIAESFALAHLSDLYARLFVRLVDAAVPTTAPAPGSLPELRANVARSDLGARLRASTFDSEARDALALAPRGGDAHALALVLTALWGVLTGPAPAAQAALAAALVQAKPTSTVDSVRAVLDLLYPGSGYAKRGAAARPGGSAHAQSLDAMARAMVALLGMLVEPATGAQLVRQTAKVRALLAQCAVGPRAAQAQDEGSDDERDDEPAGQGRADEDAAYENARERLVDALVGVTRRVPGHGPSRRKTGPC